MNNANFHNIQSYRQAEQALWEHYGVQPRERFLHLTKPNVRIRVLEVDQGEPVLFVHGGPNATSTWAALAALLQDFRCIILDRPGCGLSDPILNGVRQGETLRFRPGETVQGRVTVTPRRDVPCDHLYVRLIWRTKGIGTRYEKKIAEADFFQGTLRKGTPILHDFTFTLPNEPWSYEGKKVSVVCAVEVQMDIPRARDVLETFPFVLHPNGRTSAYAVGEQR